MTGATTEPREKPLAKKYVSMDEDDEDDDDDILDVQTDENNGYLFDNSCDKLEVSDCDDTTDFDVGRHLEVC